MPAITDDSERLSRELSLFDVYAICTGAMFSSGFFLLPGIAAAESGPAVIVAYVVSAVLVLPALFSKAELSTAMPRAGGTYFFLDRSLGPLAGTVGGLGTWISLILKSAFALIGIGAYTGIYLDLPIEYVAVALTVGFLVVNWVGAKESGRAQGILVVLLLGILGLFLASAGLEIGSRDYGALLEEQFLPFLPYGVGGLLTTVGMVFVSYTGLTKVASVAEEVKNPDRNIPLGMLLALGTTTLIYALGVSVMVAVLDPVDFRSDLTPVATAASEIFGRLPSPEIGVALVVLAALAASASTANAGIMSASRYPLAMARDRLVPDALARVGRFQTPGRSLLLTSGVVVAIIVFMEVENVVKLASAFKLLIFSLVNVSVVVMREARIPSYIPGYRTPLYPWMQVVGAVLPLWLLTEMGAVPLWSALGVTVACTVWYYAYAKERVERRGAIFHLFRRLGRHRFDQLDHELRHILAERAAEEEAEHPELDAVLEHAPVLDIPGEVEFEKAAELAAFSALRHPATEQLEVDSPELLAERLLVDHPPGKMPVSRGVALSHARLSDLDEPVVLLVRSVDGISVPGGDTASGRGDDESDAVHALLFVLSPATDPSEHLRLLAALAARTGREGFVRDWLAASSFRELRNLLHIGRSASRSGRLGSTG